MYFSCPERELCSLYTHRKRKYQEDAAAAATPRGAFALYPPSVHLAAALPFTHIGYIQRPTDFGRCNSILCVCVSHQCFGVQNSRFAAVRKVGNWKR